MRRYGPIAKLDLVPDDKFIEIVKNGKTMKDIAIAIGYSNIMSCDLQRRLYKRCESLGVELNLSGREKRKNDIRYRTKGNLFANRPNWWAAATNIRKHARKVYERSDKPKCCAICGYKHYYEVCHLRAVSDFPDDTLISEINKIDNLIALCPNHHWEFDHGLLKIDKQL